MSTNIHHDLKYQLSSTNKKITSTVLKNILFALFQENKLRRDDYDLFRKLLYFSEFDYNPYHLFPWLYPTDDSFSQRRIEFWKRYISTIAPIEKKLPLLFEDRPLEFFDEVEKYHFDHLPDNELLLLDGIVLCFISQEEKQILFKELIRKVLKNFSTGFKEYYTVEEFDLLHDYRQLNRYRRQTAKSFLRFLTEEQQQAKSKKKS